MTTLQVLRLTLRPRKVAAEFKKRQFWAGPSLRLSRETEIRDSETLGAFRLE